MTYVDKAQKRKPLKKKERLELYKKYDGKCAYCGEDIEYKDMQADHIKAKHRGGECVMDNFNPSCAVCNKWKKTYNIEQFREEIEFQVERLHKWSSNYRMASKYGLIKETNINVKFHFELLDEPLEDVK